MKIVITARNFSTDDKSALQMLLSAGFEVTDYSCRGMGTGTGDEEMAEAIGAADIAITGLEPLSRYTISRCPNLKMLSKRSIGYDTVDLEACRQSGITVTRTTGMVEGAVAEHVMAYILYFARAIHLQNADMHRGLWQRKMTSGAKNRTLGLIGFGGIGKEIARRAVPFGMKVLYYCRHPQEAWEMQYGVKYCSLAELLAVSDYVSVNVPLTASTAGMFGAEQFAAMKPGSIFINIARSGVMDDEALKKALDSGHLRGACVDVFSHEPCTDSPLITCPNAVLTPHSAPYTSENFSAMNRMAAQNVIDYVNGCLIPENILVQP